MLKVRTVNIKELLFVLALALKPFYIRESGTLQISDIIYVMLFGLCLLSGRLSFPSDFVKKWTNVFAVIITYQIIVNTIAYFITASENYSDERFFKFNLFYIFNLIVCICVFQLYSAIGYKRLLKMYLIGSALSVGVCYLGVVLNYTGDGRERGFFNNPNQLGYFAIIIMSVFVIYCRQLPKSIRIAIIVLCLVLNILSLSKASIIGSAVLLMAYALVSNDERGLKKTVTMIVLIILVATIIYLIMFSDIGLLTENYYVRTMRSRILMMQYENDSDLRTGRGYGRIKEIGALILTGVGEGAFDRFTAASRKELHSMYASILVSYGIFTFTGYVYLFKQALFSNKKRLFNILAFSGILIYCISHNGVRNTLLWTLLAMLLLRKYEDADKTVYR